MIFALQNTYPIAISWIPIAIAFGLIVQNVGGNFLWAGLSCFVCPFGTLQMISFSFAASNVAWFTMLVTSFAVTCRHLFYGLPFIEKFRAFGKAKNYMIYMMCDELFSVYADIKVPDDIDEKKAYIAVAVTLQLYWIILSMLGALLGSIIPFNLEGVDFALTALFTVITVNIILESKKLIPVIFAVVIAVITLLIIGPDSFLVPALSLITVVLLFIRPILDKSRKEESHDI